MSPPRRCLLIALLGSLAACTSDDVVLYEVPSSTPAAGGAGAPMGGALAGGFAGAAAGGASAGLGGATPAGGQAGGGAAPAGGATPAGGQAGGGQGGSSGATPCATVLDCPSSHFCDKADCVAPRGICLPRPTNCSSERQVVCGCDRVTYYNDCLRQRYGIQASAFGECRGNARRCRLPEDCAVADAVCGRLSPPEFCDAIPEGICWILPSACDELNPLPWVPCPDASLPPPTALSCVGMCEAIRSGRAHVPPPPGSECR